MIREIIKNKNMNKIALSLILFFCVILNTTIYSQIKKDKDAQKVYNSLKESKNNDTISKYSVKLSDYYLSKIFDPKTKPDYKDEYIVSTPKNQTGFKLEKTLNLIQYEKVKIHRSPNCKSLERGRERSLS